MEVEHSFHGLEVRAGEDFEKLGWGSGYLERKVKRGIKQRDSAICGVALDLERVDSDQLELARNPERADSKAKQRVAYNGMLLARQLSRLRV